MASTSSELSAKVDAASQAAEHVDKVAVSQILNSENIYDRVSLAQLVKQRVDSDRTANPNLPEIELSTKQDFTGQDVLIDMQATQTSTQKPSNIYHSEFTQGQFDSPYSFSHPKMTTYDTLDPTSGKPIEEEVTLADGTTSHNTFQYDPVDQSLQGKHWHWSSGVTEQHNYDKNGREIITDTDWKADGKPHHRNVTNTYDPITGRRVAEDLTFDGEDTRHSTFDQQGRLLTEDGGSYHYVAKYDDQTGKMTYEHRKSAELEETSTYDSETGKPLTQESKYSWGTITQEYRYDPETKNEIYHHRLSDDSEDTETHDAQGRPLTEDATRKDHKTYHSETKYDATGKFLTRDLKDFNGNTTHEEMQYDPKTGQRLKYTSDSKYNNGTTAHEEDLFDKETGLLNSEEVISPDKSKELFTYIRPPENNPDGDNLLGIREVATSASGQSKTYDYQFTYNRSDPKHPKEMLKLLWRGSGPGGSLSQEDESRIFKLEEFHIPKAINK